MYINFPRVLKKINKSQKISSIKKVLRRNLRRIRKFSSFMRDYNLHVLVTLDLNCESKSFHTSQLQVLNTNKFSKLRLLKLFNLFSPSGARVASMTSFAALSNLIRIARSELFMQNIENISLTITKWNGFDGRINKAFIIQLNCKAHLSNGWHIAYDVIYGLLWLTACWLNTFNIKFFCLLF